MKDIVFPSEIEMGVMTYWKMKTAKTDADIDLLYILNSAES